MALVTRSALVLETEPNPYRPTDESLAIASTTKELSTTTAIDPLVAVSEEDLIAIEATIIRLTR